MSRAALVSFLIVAAALAACVDRKEALGPDASGPAGAPDVFAAFAWRALASAPTPRTEVAVAALGAKIYVIGGFVENGSPTATVEVYDAETDRWSRGADYPVTIHHTVAVVHNGAIHVLGGYLTAAFDATSLAFKYDPRTNLWTPLALLPEARGAHAAGLVEGKAYLVGGVGAGGQLLRPVHVYDPAANGWSTGAEFPEPRDHLTATVHDGKLYAIGGRQKSLSTNTGRADRYDPGARTWDAAAPMPTPRGGLASALVRDRIVVIGGEEPTRTIASVEAFDARNNTWASLPELPTPRHGLGATTVGDEYFAMLGGPQPGLKVSGAVEAWGPTGGR